MIRAVVFDLWDTLVDFDPVAGRAFQDRVAERLGREPDELAALWARLDTEPARPALGGGRDACCAPAG